MGRNNLLFIDGLNSETFRVEIEVPRREDRECLSAVRETVGCRMEIVSLLADSITRFNSVLDRFVRLLPCYYYRVLF